MCVLSNGNVGATAKSVHSRHGEVIKFADISPETMFRAAQLWKVCYRQTIVTSVRESKFSFAISKTHGGEMKSPRTEKKRPVEGKRKGGKEREKKKKRSERENLWATGLLYSRM